ncbi:MAG TPA: hypothetical protein VIR33_15890, partial [Thermopolyspora sp.]
MRLNRHGGSDQRRIRQLRARRLRRRWRSLIAGLASVLMLGTTPGLGLWPASDPPAARHRAQPAPTQRWGAATAQDHIVGSSGNRTEPTTLRAL